MALTRDTLEVVWLGNIEYKTAWTLQNRLASEIAAGTRAQTLLLLEHPHVYTIGRRGGQANLIWDEHERARRGIDLIEVDRGGDITYHGPGQLVGYPLVKLAAPGWQGERLPQADYVGYLRKLEEVIIDTLASFSIQAVRKEDFTGVWVPQPRMAASLTEENQDAKIASIGVKVDAKGATRHGFALNVQPHMEYWQGIIACGLEGVRMVSMAELTSPAPEMSIVMQRLARIFARTFQFNLVWKNQIAENRS